MLYDQSGFVYGVVLMGALISVAALFGRIAAWLFVRATRPVQGTERPS